MTAAETVGEARGAALRRETPDDPQVWNADQPGGQAVCSVDCLLDAPDAVQEPARARTATDDAFVDAAPAATPGAGAARRPGWTRWAAGVLVTLGGLGVAQLSHHLGLVMAPRDAGAAVSSRVVQAPAWNPDGVDASAGAPSFKGLPSWPGPFNGAERASSPAECLAAVRRLTIQYHGRLQSFDSFARDILAFTTGQARLDQDDPVQTVLSMIAGPARWKDRPLLAVPASVQALLHLPPGAARASWTDAHTASRFLAQGRAAAERKRRGRRLSPADRDAAEVYERFLALSDLFEQELYLVPPPAPGQQHWLPILRPDGYDWTQQVSVKKTWSAFLSTVSSRRPDRIQSTGKQLATLLQPRGW